MQTNTEYKNLAIRALTGNWGKGAIATFIYLLIYIGISGAVSISQGGDNDSLNSSDVIVNIIEILLIPIAWGITVFFLDIYRGNNPGYGQIFDGFRSGYGRILGTLLLEGVYTALWSLLLIIPGIVKSYSYALTSFVLKDNPSLKYNAAIEESMRLMEGHKMQLFLLDLSMIGWFILSCLTLGIGFLFLAPYIMTAHAAFYEDLKAEDGGESVEVTEVVI